MRYKIQIKFETPGEAEFDEYGEDVVKEFPLTAQQRSSILNGAINGLLSAGHSEGIVMLDIRGTSLDRQKG